MSDTFIPPPVDPRVTRRKRLTLFAGVAAIAGGAWGASALMSHPNLRSTDDAYVNGHVVQITPETTGTVARVFADNTDAVRPGAALIELDGADAGIEFATAEAELANAIRNVRGFLASDERFNADVRLQEAELARALADLKARQSIAGTGAVTDEDVRHAADAVRTVSAALTASREARAESLTRTAGATLASHPAVQIAIEHVRTAALKVERTRIKAPVGGMVAQRTVQLGRHVSPGERLMSIVPLDQLWVDANFKEIQLRGICPGQPAEITADMYGRKVVYHGRVEGIEAGTGAAFALLPAQNATGNWIKVVQRAPVRISLDAAELARNPLRIGMSTEVQVDTGQCDSKSAEHKTSSVAETGAIYEQQLKSANDTVDRIIAANIEKH